MIALSTEATDVLTRSYEYHVAIESWLDGQLLAADVPVDSASEETDRSINVPERITLTVPRMDRGTSWSPTTDDHPLAANGQRIHVKLGVGLSAGRIEWFQRGWFLLEDSNVDGDTVNVTAVGLLALLDEARLVSPYQPSGTLVSTLRGLIEPALTVVVDAGLTDRSVPDGVNYDEDRLGAVNELIDAWPAYAYVDPTGFLNAVPATQSRTPVLALTDGRGGTVIRASGSSTRDGAYNVVVATGTAADGTQVQGVAYDQSSGPKRFSGPFSPLPVPYFYASPLLTTADACRAAAATTLARLLRAVTRQYTVEMVPNPALQVGDVVSITTDELAGVLCSIETLTLPYLASGGSQTLTIATLP